jgi:D-3-phosphoglycerate dehydrogenase
MTAPSSLADCRIVRLNAELFPVSREEQEACRRHGIEPEPVEAETEAELREVVAGADAVFAVSVKLPASVIAAMDRCRVISRMGAGTDRIDVQEATRRGILVTNVADFCVEEQADHAMAMLLAIERQFKRMDREMAAGHWTGSREVSGRNHRLPGRTLGLVGFGRSARAMARRARGFDMRLLATRRRELDDPELAELGVELVSLDELLARSDYVSLHLPLTEATYHLIDAEALQRMKPGAILINTSRGAIVCEEALVAALDDRRLRGAGLDVFEQINVHDPDEVPPRDSPLIGRDDIVVTPHVAAFSVESREDVTSGSVANLVDVLEGRWPTSGNIVNTTVVPRWPLEPRSPAG